MTANLSPPSVRAAMPQIVDIMHQHLTKRWPEACAKHPKGVLQLDYHVSACWACKRDASTAPRARQTPGTLRSKALAPEQVPPARRMAPSPAPSAPQRRQGPRAGGQPAGGTKSLRCWPRGRLRPACDLHGWSLKPRQDCLPQVRALFMELALGPLVCCSCEGIVDVEELTTMAMDVQVTTT